MVTGQKWKNVTLLIIAESVNELRKNAGIITQKSIISITIRQLTKQVMVVIIKTNMWDARRRLSLADRYGGK